MFYVIDMTENAIGKKTYWFVFHNDRLVLSKQGDASSLPLSDDPSLKQFKIERKHHLGQFDSFEVICAEVSNLPSDFDTVSLRKALEAIGEHWYSIATKAFAIINWDKNHQFCGKCGSKTVHKSQSFERFCETCHQTFYPRISPSVIVLIERGEELLMARSPYFNPGVYALIAGFVEAGETLEEAVHREVKEEVGIKIKNLRYFSSQSWPFPDSLMVGFTADYDSGELNIDPIEIEDAGWYRYDQLPGRPSTNISISSKLIDHFLSKHGK